MLTPAEMARIAHAAEPNATSPPTIQEFEKLLATPNIFTVQRPEGFLIFQVAGSEADIHSFTVAPNSQNRGIGTDMLRDGLGQLRDRGVQEVFLEVDTTNLPALKLYTRAGFFVVGHRPQYYRHAGGTVSDAYTMAYYYGNEDRIGAAERTRLSL